MEKSNNPETSRLESGKGINTNIRMSDRSNAPKYILDAYQNVDTAKDLIKNRLEKLKYEAELLKNMKSSMVPLNRDVGMLYNMRNLNNNRGNLNNPNLYSHQYIDPIYYPLEMPVNAEPITLPKIELGRPLVDPPEDDGGGLGLSDLLALLAAMKNNNEGNSKPMFDKTDEPDPDDSEKKNREKKPIKKPPEGKMKRDWWKLAKAFVNMYKYYSIGNKYGKHSNVRNSVINDLTKGVYGHIDSLKNWIISIQQSFWDEFKVFQDLDLSFNNFSGDLKIMAQSQKINAVLNIYLRNLLAKATKINELPEKIQDIIYRYIREKAYFPKGFLSTFEVNRLDFNFFGGTKNLTDAEVGMIVAFLILSRTTVQQILLHPIENFEHFKTFPKIQISCKYVGSILHYLCRDAFKASPPMVKELLALLNYYRNYHIFNKQVEEQQDLFNTNMVFRDEDELAKNLVPENTITKYWNIKGNQAKIMQFTKIIYQWAIHIGKQIRTKYSRYDKNLEKKTIKRPVAGEGS